MAFLAACQRRAACTFSALQGLYLVSLVPFDGWCPQPAREGLSSLPCHCLPERSKDGWFPKQELLWRLELQNCIYTVGKIRQLFWNEGKSFLFYIFLSTEWWIYLKIRSCFQREFWPFCFCVASWRKSRTQVQPYLQTQMLFCTSVHSLMGQRQCWCHKHLWCTAASLPSLDDSVKPSWCPLVTFQLSASTPVPLVFERATAVTAVKSFRTF